MLAIGPEPIIESLPAIPISMSYFFSVQRSMHIVIFVLLPFSSIVANLCLFVFVPQIVLVENPVHIFATNMFYKLFFGNPGLVSIKDGVNEPIIE